MASVDDDIFLIRQLLAWAGTNPSRAARQIGVANTTLNRFANGTARSRIGRETLGKLRAAFPDFPGFRALDHGEGSANPLPVHGTMFTTVDVDSVAIEQALVTRDSVDTLPASLLSQRYPGTIACHVQGSSMTPALREGELIAIAPSPAVTPGDLVAVWLTPGTDMAGRPVLLKELVRRSASAVELREYDPPRVVAVPNERVERIDRILSRGDLLRNGT